MPIAEIRPFPNIDEVSIFSSSLTAVKYTALSLSVSCTLNLYSLYSSVQRKHLPGKSCSRQLCVGDAKGSWGGEVMKALEKNAVCRDG